MFKLLYLALSGTDKHLKKIDNADQGLEVSTESVQHNVWRKIAELLNPEKIIYTKFFTEPSMDSIAVLRGNAIFGEAMWFRWVGCFDLDILRKLANLNMVLVDKLR